MNNYDTILLKESDNIITITINRSRNRNSINNTFVKELLEVLEEIRNNPIVKIVVIEGQDSYFCTGMDFEELTTNESNKDIHKQFTETYMKILNTFSLYPKIIISIVDGQVIAGGVGIAAASDLVIATPRSEFSLPEALWGLLPSMVIPYLIRRTGFQKAYRMTLTTQAISAKVALEINLIDELTDKPDESIRRLALRIGRIDEETIINMKAYFGKMWIINEEIAKIAIAETTRLLSENKVRDNITNFVKYKKFPWEKQ